jgi:putative hydrolase of the HAD superfamily
VRRFDAVLFDAGETLLHPDPSFPELIARFVRERGHDVSTAAVVDAEAALASALADRFVSGRGWSLSGKRSREHWTGLYREFALHLGIVDPGLPDHLYDRFAMPEHYALFPDAIPALRGLRADGYRLGVVSNFEAWLEGLLVSLEVLPMLDAVVVSGAEGVEKPDPKIFEIALERLGVAAERACFVGDSPHFDFDAARAAGMRALLIDRRGRHDPERLPVIRSLADVAEALA